MARTITIDTINENTGDVKFTVSGAKKSELNGTFTVNGLPVDTKVSLIQAIKDYLDAYKAGLDSTKKATPDASVTAIVGQAQTATEV